MILPFPSMPRIPSPPLESLPNRIREWRQARRLTLKQLAAEAHLAWAHLSKLELGQRELNQETMDRIAAALGVDAADLLLLEKGGLTVEERRLVAIYRDSGAQSRATINAVADTVATFRHEGDVVPLRP